MFVGHFALGFAAKRVSPRAPLPVLFGAAQLADLMWPVLVALGIEQVRIDPGNTAFTPLDFVSYPYSHSLLLLVVWGAVFALVYRWARGADSRVGMVLFALVVSHWVLDYITHRPDMPIYPGGPKVGLGLWNSVAATMAVELTMFVAGVAIYQRVTRPRDRRGRWGYALFAAVLGVGFAANVGATPPPSVTALWITAVIGGAVLLVWSWWVDRHRDVY